MEIGPVLHSNVIGVGSKTCRAGTQSMIQKLIKGFCMTSGELTLIFVGHGLDQRLVEMVAIQIIRASLEPGQYSSASQTFDTVRRLCAAFANIYMSSVDAHLQWIHFPGDIGASYHAVPHPTHSPLFQFFMCGLLQ
eukprot:3427446-Ditylum_brightwellii.AAC.1